MPTERSFDHNSLELVSYNDDGLESDDPDSPLPEPTYSEEEDIRYTTPRWLQTTPPWTRRIFRRANSRMATLRPRWLEGSQSSLWQRALDLLRPRLTFSYVLFVAVALYVLYCYIVWSPLFASRLPPYTGPYDVGAVDVEVPVADPRQIVDALFRDRKGTPFQLDTVLFTIYYPAVRGVKSKPIRMSLALGIDVSCSISTHKLRTRYETRADYV